MDALSRGRIRRTEVARLGAVENMALGSRVTRRVLIRV